MPRLNIGVWGVGPHALKNVLPAIKASPHLQLAGVHTRNRDTVQSVSNQYGCLAWADAREMLADEGVDAVYLSTPIGLHYEQGVRVLESGKHLIAEKSLTGTLAHTKKLAALARERTRVLCEAFMYLYHPQFARIHEILSQDGFAKTHSMGCEFLLPKLQNPGYRSHPSLGGGAFLDVACYPVSMLVNLSHCFPEPALQYSRIDFDPSFGADTSGFALFRAASGTHISLAWGYGFAYRNQLAVSGEKQSMSASFAFSKKADQRTKIRVGDQFGAEIEIEIPAANSFVEMFAYFAAATQDPVLRENLVWQVEQQASLMEEVRCAAQ